VSSTENLRALASAAVYPLISIDGSRIFRGGDFVNPSERSERALRGSELTGEGFGRGGAQNNIEIT